MESSLCSESLEEGRLRCSRCELTFYKDRESQKKQWKIHKKVCSPITDSQKARIDAMSLSQATKYFGQSLMYDANDTVYVIQHIRKLFDEKADDPDDVEMELHSVCRGTVLFSYSDLEIYKFYARPGMTNYLLTDNQEDLLNPETRLWKTELSRYNGRPFDEYIEHFITDPTEKERVKAACKAYEEAEKETGGFFSSPPSMKFCYLYYNLIVGAAIHASQSMSSVHDGNGRLRGQQITQNVNTTALAKKALTRAMELWADPYARGSCGDAMAPAASLALTALRSRKFASDEDSPQQLIPGLTVDAAVLTCLAELEERAGSGKYSEKLLHAIASAEPVLSYQQWSTMPLENRARVARGIVSYLLNHGADNVDFTSNFGDVAVPAAALKVLLFNSCETEDSEGTNVRRQVWKLCAENEFLGPEPCGHNFEARAYFHFLLRLTEQETDKVLTAEDTIDAWIATPWPKKGKQPSAQSSEKKACMALAQGDEYHAEWCGWMKVN